MSLAALFKRLHAPLKNPRWSWGAVSLDGSVFLRVWQDREISLNGSWFMQVTHGDAYLDDPNNPGHHERLSHVEKIRAGAKSYMVMCKADDVAARPRKIRSFNRDELFAGGTLIEHGNELWLERLSRVPVSSFY